MDVRDIALVHAMALEKDNAGGERIIISEGKFTSKVPACRVQVLNCPLTGGFIWQEWRTFFLF